MGDPEAEPLSSVSQMVLIQQDKYRHTQGRRSLLVTRTFGDSWSGSGVQEQPLMALHCLQSWFLNHCFKLCNTFHDILYVISRSILLVYIYFISIGVQLLL